MQINQANQTNTVKRLVITPGEPAGIGPELILALAKKNASHELVICASLSLLKARAKALGLNIQFLDYDPNKLPCPQQKGRLLVWDTPLKAAVKSGVLEQANSAYVLETLTKAAKGAITGEFAALITGPVHKGIINQAGFSFSGHTEFLAALAKVEKVVMMLATKGLRVALVTTHLPLAKVSEAITKENLIQTIRILHHDLIHQFGILSPRIYVCGLNPHAGEDGCLGHEEIETITPTLDLLRAEGMQLMGPLPADTLFQDKYLNNADAVLAMYHDQGLPVLKYKGFGQSVNITLGLPFIRTSVDHGTALDLAGTGTADTGSFWTALSYATQLVDKQA